MTQPQDPEQSQNAAVQPPQAHQIPPAPPTSMTPPPPSPHPLDPRAASRVTRPESYPPAATPPAGFRRGFGAGAGAGVGLGLTLVIGMMVSSLVFGLLVGLGAAGGGGTDTTMKTIWGAENSANTIYALRIDGVILAASAEGSTLTGGTYGYEIAQQIDALKPESAAGLLLIINTPGGSINGSKAIADAVSRYQARTKKKVVAHVQGMSASGGMYAMAGADKIIADYGSLVGSIGVIMGPFERYNKVIGTTGTVFTPGIQTTGGIESEYLTMGRGKDFGSPYRDMTKEEREVMLAGLRNVYNDFVGQVAKGRNLEPGVITGKLGAHIFDSKSAIAAGLIDSELGIDDAYREAAKVMGVDAAATRIVTPTEPGMLAQLLGVQARVPGHAAKLADGQRPSAVICGSTPRALVYYGEPATVCG